MSLLISLYFWLAGCITSADGYCLSQKQKQQEAETEAAAAAAGPGGGAGKKKKKVTAAQLRVQKGSL